MKCPFCGNESTDVIETRDGEGATRRRRECRKCLKRFTTYERAENICLVVIKKDGRREKFDREKLRSGIARATQKRPVSLEQVSQLVDEIERDLFNRDGVEIGSKVIGNLVLKKLRKLDKVAYMRFASVYLDFSNLEDFERLINKTQDLH